MTRVAVLISLAILASACTTSLPAVPPGAGLEALNRGLASVPRLDVQLADGRMVEIDSVHLGSAQTVMKVASTGAKLVVPTASILRMTHRRRSGTRTGLLIGLAPGAALFLGGLIHAVTTDGYGTLAGIGVMGVGVSAGALGAGIGAFVGHRVRPAERTVVYQGPVVRYLKSGEAQPGGRR